MRCASNVLKLALTAAGCLVSGAAYAAPDAKGIWINDGGRGAVEIKDCDGKLCGHVVWTRDATDASRGCGKQIIGDVPPAGKGVWDGGWIYSPDRKRRFDVEITPLDDGTLKVKGYAGSKFLSKTMIWTPAPDDLQRCNKSETEAANTAPAAKSEAPAPVAKAAPAPEPKEEARAEEAAPAKPAPAKPAAKKAAEAPVEEPADEPRDETASESAPAEKNGKRQKVAKAEEAEEEIDIDALIDKVEGMEFGDGYGVKRVGDGDCRLKVPYVTVTIPCKK